MVIIKSNDNTIYFFWMQSEKQIQYSPIVLVIFLEYNHSAAPVLLQ